MKKITIYQKGNIPIEVFDDSDEAIDEYSKELSKLFQSTNIAILKTSTCNVLVRPSALTGLFVEDSNEFDPTVESKDLAVEIKLPEKVEEDIITDID